MHDAPMHGCTMHQCTNARCTNARMHQCTMHILCTIIQISVDIIIVRLDRRLSPLERKCNQPSSLPLCIVLCMYECMYACMYVCILLCSLYCLKRRTIDVSMRILLETCVPWRAVRQCHSVPEWLCPSLEFETTLRKMCLDYLMETCLCKH